MQPSHCEMLTCERVWNVKHNWNVVFENIACQPQEMHNAETQNAETRNAVNRKVSKHEMLWNAVNATETQMSLESERADWALTA